MATVVVQQPLGKMQIISHYVHFWSSGCYAYWCFPCFTCSTTGDFGESTCLPLLDIFVCVPPVGLAMRVAVRYKYHIGGSLCEDIMVTCCCIWCSWCQMSREIKARKKVVRILQRNPMIQPVPMAVNPQVVAMQQPRVIGAAPLGAGPAVQMGPIKTGVPPFAM
uniref:Cornifelin homolog B-like n=1 Tax=Sinocyclocheilus rhinocerous TaxID=307959 RepID=A0A673LGU2_9TELE